MFAREEFPPEGIPFGRYRVIRKIHHGALGTLFKGKIAETEECFASKILDCDLDAPVQRRRRFVNEISALEEFDHPNIVPVLESGEAAGCPYFTMPWINDADFRTIIEGLRSASPEIDFPTEVHAENQSGQLSQGDPKAHVRRGRSNRHPGGGLRSGTAHSIGLDRKCVLHRDIKPSNLMLDRAGQVFLIDFGLARWEGGETLTESHALMGTFQYMAPERLIGNIGPRSDIYSLGLVLYELLTLQKPFDERLNLLELSRQIESSQPPKVRSIRPDIPKDLERIVRHAIEKEPAHRYPSAKALADDLRRFVRGENVPRRSPRIDQRARAWTKRNPWLSIATTTAIIGCSLSLVAFVSYLDARARFAESRLSAAHIRERESEFRSIQSQTDLLMDEDHFIGWAHRLEPLIDRAAAISGGAELRDLVIRTLVGEDLEQEFKLDDFGSSSVAFDGDGDRLVLGGLNAWRPAKGTQSGPPCGPEEASDPRLEGTWRRTGHLRPPRPPTPVQCHHARQGGRLGHREGSGCHQCVISRIPGMLRRAPFRRTVLRWLGVIARAGVGRGTGLESCRRSRAATIRSPGPCPRVLARWRSPGRW